MNSITKNNLKDENSNKTGILGSTIVLPQNYVPTEMEDYMNDNPGKFSHQLKGVLRYIDNSKFDENAYKLFKAKTFYYDKIRNRDFVETFPELVDVI